MVDPIFIGLGGAAIAIGGAAIYAFTSGNSASADVDIDGDGESEGSVTFNHDDGDDHKAEAGQQKTEDPTPDYVTEDYDGLEDITGVGPTRAGDLSDAGLPDPVDIYYAADSTLLDVTGIGPRALEQIRGDIGGVDASGNGKSDEEPAEDSQESEDEEAEETDSSSSEKSESE